MAIAGAAFLLAIGRVLARSRVEHDGLRRSPLVHLIDRLPRQIGERNKVLGSSE